MPKSAKGLNAVLANVFVLWIANLPADLLESVGILAQDLVETIPRSYTVHKPLLLLPRRTFENEPWQKLYRVLDSSYKLDLYHNLAVAFRATHVAIEGKIPRCNVDDIKPNMLRIPHELKCVYGDFGPTVLGSPTSADFEAALWIHVKQHGIIQTYAPKYTMFSQGNITEKKRVMDFENPIAPDQDKFQSTAVDLYAGIGYFIFPYLKAGMTKVIGWELNPWSIEGLRKGASKNRLSVKVYHREDIDGKPPNNCVLGVDENIVIFEENNVNALVRISSLRGSIPSVRHINCGLLPTSEAIWEDSVKMIDPVLGGWIHAHENIAAKSIAIREEEIVSKFARYAAPRNVHCEHVERVKSYGPGVIHCVLDIHIGAAK